MRLKAKELNKHTELVAGVAWSRKNELYSSGDDAQIWKWDINGEPIEKVLELDNHVTSMSWLQGTVGAQELLAAGCANGSFKLISKGTRVEKNIPDAHSGAITCIKWSYEGTALATSGEDGQIKIWSKSGLLRSNLAQISHPIYCVVWSPDNEAILYCSERSLSVMPQMPGNKQLSWKAHDGIVLAADWNPANNLIASAGQDCKFRIWDAFGRQLFASSPYDYVITSVAWSPSGQLLAVGSFQMLRLCDKSGWTHSFSKPSCGSLMALSWSPDGTILAGGGGTGQIILGHLIGRQLSWGNIDVMVEDERVVSVTNVLHGVKQEPDFRDRVVNLSVGFGYTVVATTSQCFIYNVNNWSTPYNFDLKDAAVTIIVQSRHHFALIDALGISIYNYEGKILSQPKYSGLRVQFLSSRCVSLSRDVIALLDTSNRKHVRLFDVFSGKALNLNIEYTAEIVELMLNQVDGPNERKLCFIDSNRDMFLTSVRRPQVLKIANMVDSFQWHDQSDMLAALADSKLISWFYPNAIYVDKDLMDKSKSSKEIPEVGKLATVLNFSGTTVSIRRIDGALGSYAVSPYPRFLYEQVQTAMGPASSDGWERAIKLCRYVNDPTLWATLAAMSIYCRAYNPAEIALASIDQIDKVQFINYVKELPSEQSRNAAFALYCKRINQAEQILLQAKLFYRAIKMNIKLFRWDRALELALQHKTHVDTVLAYRQRYMKQLGKEEKEQKFIELSSSVEVDWQAIKRKIAKEKAHESGQPVQQHHQPPPTAAEDE